MKLVFVCGANGVGKSTTCKRLNESLNRSAHVDSDWCRCMNPYDFSQEHMRVNEKNMTSLLSNYFSSELFDFIIWNYSFHGKRRQIYDNVVTSLQKYQYTFLPFILTCDAEANVHRMRKDGRDERRIRYSIKQSRQAYDGLPFARIDTTTMGIDEVVSEMKLML